LVQVLVAKDNSGDTRYVYGVTRIGEQQSAGWLYHLTDALGSVRQLVDGSGNVQLARGYTPYGEPLWLNGTASSRYAFTGEDYDPTVGLVFLRARYIQPALGMFLARDPWNGDTLNPITLNGFTYTSANPINRVDPSGLFDLETIARTYNMSPDLAPALPYMFKENAGWLQLLLDAKPDDVVTVGSWPILTGGQIAGIVACRNGRLTINGVSPWFFLSSHDSTAVNPIIKSWGSVPWYSLNGTGPFEQIWLGGYYSNRYATISLPDYVVAAYVGHSVGVGGGGVVGLIDRYGNIYGGVHGGIGPSFKWFGGSTILGGGYLEKPFSNQVPSEDQLKSALQGLSVSIGVDAGGAEASIFGTWGYWGYYTSLGVHVPGLTLIGAQVTTFIGKDESFGWYRLEHGISMADYTRNPASKISCGCEK